LSVTAGRFPSPATTASSNAPTQDSRSYFLEFAPELRLVAAPLRVYVEELYDYCASEKVGSRDTQVGNRIENQGTGGVEDRFIMVAIELPATETSASG